ncbi:MAG: hypothetical protein V4671_01150 [Armatimonadota bacterium]
MKKYSVCRPGSLGALFVVSLLGTGLIATPGCGGGNGSSSVSQGQSPSSSKARGVVSVSITWPERTRLIPIMSESVKVTVARVGGTGVPIAPQILRRVPLDPPPSFPVQPPMTSTASFPDLEVGEYTVTATAYPTADGTGTAQATATVSATVVGDENTPVGLVMGTTVDHLEVTAVSSTLTVGETTILTVTPRDAAGQAVLIDRGRTRYSSSAPGVAEADLTQFKPGEYVVLARGTAAGLATITVTDTETGKSGTVTLTVKAKPLPQPKGYSITHIPAYPGYPFMNVKAINNLGEVAGSVSVGSAATAADRLFIWRPNPTGNGGKYTDLGSFPGFSVLYVQGMNDKGEICGDGSRSSFSSESHAFVYRNGAFVDLGIPNPELGQVAYNTATSINNAGQISGHRRRFAVMSEAFVWQNGQIKYLDRTKAASTIAISSLGLVTGWDGKNAAYRYDVSTDQYSELQGAPGFGSLSPKKIRDDGLVVGYLSPPTGVLSRACYWEGGKSQPTLLDPLPGAATSAAWSVNSSGTIAGYSILPDRMVAVRWIPGQSVAQDLNTLVPSLGTGSKALQTTQDINEAGQIIGTSSFGSYVLTPLP